MVAAPGSPSAATPVPEPAKAGPTPAEKAEEARRQFQRREEARQIKIEKDRLATERAAIEADKLLAKNQPEKFEEKYGMSYAERTRRLLLGETAVSEAEQQQTQVVQDLEAIKKERADEKAAAELAQHQRVMNDWRGQVKEHLDKTPELELCRIDPQDSIATIEQIVRLHLDQTGEIMPFTEAATKLEEFLVQRADQYFTKSAKLKAKYGPPAPPPAPAEAKPGANGSPVPTPEGKNGGAPAPVQAEGLKTSSVQRRTRTLSNGLTETPGTKVPGKRQAKGGISISDAIAASSRPSS